MSPTLLGVLFALAAAICYGFIPFFTLPLKEATSTANFMPDPRFSFTALASPRYQCFHTLPCKVSRSIAVVVSRLLAFISDGSALFLIDSYIIAKWYRNNTSLLLPRCHGTHHDDLLPRSTPAQHPPSHWYGCGRGRHSFVGPHGKHEPQGRHHCPHLGSLLCALPHSCQPFTGGATGKYQTGVLCDVYRRPHLWCRGPASGGLPPNSDHPASHQLGITCPHLYGDDQHLFGACR